MAANENVGGQNPGSNEQPGAGSGQPSGTTQPNGGGQAPVSGQPSGGTQGNGQPQQYTYKEDRSDWVPRTRLNEQRDGYEEKFKKLQQQIDDTTGRVKKAFGIESPSPEDQETEAVKAAILKIFPGLAHLGSLSKEQLDEVLDSARAARQTTVQSWERHATTMIDGVAQRIAKSFGMEKLTDRQLGRIKREYREAASASYQARVEAAERRDNTYDFRNDFLARHERGDQTLVEEFVKDFLEDFYEPARRSASAELTRRNRPLPSGDRTRTPVTSKTPEIDYNDDNAFGKALAEARNSRG